jgi:hypothetical protein
VHPNKNIIFQKKLPSRRDTKVLSLAIYTASQKHPPGYRIDAENHYCLNPGETWYTKMLTMLGSFVIWITTFSKAS